MKELVAKHESAMREAQETQESLHKKCRNLNDDLEMLQNENRQLKVYVFLVKRPGLNVEFVDDHLEPKHSFHRVRS